MECALTDLKHSYASQRTDHAIFTNYLITIICPKSYKVYLFYELTHGFEA